METEANDTTQTEAAPVETKSTEELQVAEAALAVMPGEDEVGSEEGNDGIKAESTRLTGEVTAKRAVRRALNTEIAALESKRNTLTAEPAKPPVKSPMEQFVAKNPDDMIPGKVALAETKFQEAKQATEQQAKAKADAKTALTRKGEGVIKRGREKYSDFQEVYEAAGEGLTEGNMVDIRNAEFPEDLLYKLSIRAILDRGDDTSVALTKRLRAKKVATESVKKKAPNEDGSEEVKAQTAHRSVAVARLYDLFDG